jgi:hypothetical protein
MKRAVKNTLVLLLSTLHDDCETESFDDVLLFKIKSQAEALKKKKFPLAVRYLQECGHLLRPSSAESNNTGNKNNSKGFRNPVEFLKKYSNPITSPQDAIQEQQQQDHQVLQPATEVISVEKNSSSQALTTPNNNSSRSSSDGLKNNNNSGGEQSPVVISLQVQRLLFSRQLSIHQLLIIIFCLILIL